MHPESHEGTQYAPQSPGNHTFRRSKSVGNVLLPDSVRCNFGSSVRPPLTRLDADIPGPAKYNPAYRPSSAPSYGMGRRLDALRPKTAGAVRSPGPGAYTLKDTLKTTGTSLKGKTIRGERPRSVWDIAPATGSYNLESDFLPTARRRSCSFGARFRPASAPSRCSAAPMGQISTLKHGSSRFGPPPKKSSARDRKAPGPGEYVVPSTFRHDVGRQFGRRCAPPTRSESVPGPGEYPVRSTLGVNRPSYSISGRWNDHAKSQVASTQYVLPSTFRYDTGRQFGRKVMLPNAASKFPGPGMYPVRSTLGMHRSPKYSMQSRRVISQKTCAAPSQLFLPSTFSGPKYSFGRTRVNRRVRRGQNGAVESDPYNPSWGAEDYPDIGCTWAPVSTGCSVSVSKFEERYDCSLSFRDIDNELEER